MLTSRTTRFPVGAVIVILVGSVAVSVTCVVLSFRHPYMLLAAFGPGGLIFVTTGDLIAISRGLPELPPQSAEERRVFARAFLAVPLFVVLLGAGVLLALLAS